MRRIAIGAALIGGGILVARALVPKLHARMLAGCKRMFEQKPDHFPPKQMKMCMEKFHAAAAQSPEQLGERTRAGEEPGPELRVSVSAA